MHFTNSPSLYTEAVQIDRLHKQTQDPLPASETHPSACIPSTLVAIQLCTLQHMSIKEENTAV